MRAYTDKFVVRPDGIYRIEGSYHPGGEWEEHEVLWVPRETLMNALLEWQGSDKKESETNGRCKRSRQEKKTNETWAIR